MMSLLKSKPPGSFDSFCGALGTVPEELILLEYITRAAVQRSTRLFLRYFATHPSFTEQLVVNEIHWTLINKWRSNECNDVVRTILEGAFPQGTFEIINQFVPSVDVRRPVVYLYGGIVPRPEPLLGISLTGNLDMEKAREELSTTLSQLLQIPTENIEVATAMLISFHKKFRDSELSWDENTEDHFQQIYDNALKRGSVAVNRCRVTVVGQDGAGKSCLVDSLLDRPFEEGKASTEGAALEMTHATAIGWKSIERRTHLDPLVAKVCYGIKQQSDLPTSLKEGSSDVAEQPSSNMAEHLPATPEVKLTRREEPLNDKLRAVGMIAKTLTANQKRLLEGFREAKPSEEHLSTQPFCIRDIWDLGGQEVYLATHSALMPNNRKFGLYMYMVVMDISRSLSDKAESSRASNGVEGEALGWIRKNGDFPLYWLGSIAAAHEETDRDKHWLGEDEEVDPPPVFAIGSHRDVLDSKKESFPMQKL